MLRVSSWWIFKNYMSCLIQVFFGIYGTFFFSRMISQLNYLNGDYQFQHALMYVFQVMPAESATFWLFSFYLSLLLFTLRIHFRGQDQAMRSLGFGSMSLLRVLSVPVLILYFSINLYCQEWGMLRYQEAKLMRHHLLQGEAYTVWQKDKDKFVKMTYEPMTQQIKHVQFIKIGQGSEMPDLEKVQESIFYQDGAWQTNSGHLYDFASPVFFRWQIFGSMWMSISQLSELGESLSSGWLVPFIQSFLDSLLMILGLGILLKFTECSLRAGLWKKGVMYSFFPIALAWLSSHVGLSYLLVAWLGF